MSFLLLTFSFQDKVELLYLDEKPEEMSDILVYVKKGVDVYDRIEKILIDAEKELCQYAEVNKYNLVEVFIVEQSHGEIPTESQFGKKGFVTLWVCFKKT